jgi:hypothetical protein
MNTKGSLRPLGVKWRSTASQWSIRLMMIGLGGTDSPSSWLRDPLSPNHDSEQPASRGSC